MTTGVYGFFSIGLVFVLLIIRISFLRLCLLLASSDGAFCPRDDHGFAKDCHKLSYSSGSTESTSSYFLGLGTSTFFAGLALYQNANAAILARRKLQIL